MDQKPEPQFQETMSDQCNACGSLKKKDPTTSEDASGDGQPQLNERETASVLDYRLDGFSRVAVPPPNFHTNLIPPSSNLINSPGLDLPKVPSWQNFPQSPVTPGMNPNVSTLSPSPVKGGSTELPPLPSLRRSIPESLPVGTPPRIRVAGHGQMVTGHGEMVTGSPVVYHDSPVAERFKRMMERMKEMKQWWHEVVLESEDAGSHHNNPNEASNAETEDLVIIERVGDFISICLKCPCSKTYQLLISGSDCFYRLM